MGSSGSGIGFSPVPSATYAPVGAQGSTLWMLPGQSLRGLAERCCRECGLPPTSKAIPGLVGLGELIAQVEHCDSEQQCLPSVGIGPGSSQPFACEAGGAKVQREKFAGYAMQASPTNMIASTLAEGHHGERRG